MGEKTEEGAKSSESEATPHPKFLEKRFKKGVSGNPAGRPRIEPRVRRYARTYDRAMVKVLAEIAQDPKVPPSERRRCAMDLIAVGSGRPALVQQISGRDGEPVGPLVAFNFGSGMQNGRELSPQDAYRMMVEGHLPIDPKHPAFERPVIEQQPAPKDGAEDEAVTK
jgi:hypothetical protein